MKLGLRGQLFAAAAGLGATVLVIFALLVAAIQELEKRAEQADRADEAIAAAATLQVLLLDMHAGQRGYAIAGDPVYLEPWNAARRELPAAVQNLLALELTPELAALAREIATVTENYVEEWSAPLVATASADLGKARALIRSGEGQRRIEAIRALQRRFQDAEAELDGERDAAAVASARTAFRLGVGGFAVIGLLGIAATLYFTRVTVIPVRRLRAASERLAAGDFTAQASGAAIRDVRELQDAFDAMVAAVQESRDELDRFFTLSLDLLCIAGLDGTFRRLNPAWESVLGYTADELLSRPFLDFVHPDDQAATLAEVAKLAAGAKVVSFENRYRAKDGSYRWLLWSSAPLPERGLIYAVARDITDRRLAEDEIRQLNAELESQNAELETQAVLLEENQVQLSAANDELQAQQAELERALAALADEKELIEGFYRFGERLAAEIEVEPLAEAILGQAGDSTRAEAGALYTLDLERGGVHTLVATRGLDRTRLAPTVVAGEGLTGRALAELRALRDDHGASGLRLPGLTEEIPVRHELHIPLVHAGRPVGALVLGRAGEHGFSSDELAGIGHLADQGSVALANALALRTARRLATINQAVLDTTTEGIRMVDLEGNPVVTNAAMQRMAGPLLGLGETGTIWERVAPLAERTTDPDAYRAAIAAMRADPELEATDEYQLADSGVWIQRFTAPVRNESGALVGRIIVLRDITAQREANRFKDELVATVSHELRTPLTGILGFSELLVSREVDAATRTRYLETIYQEARRLSDLVNDFLDVQRFEAGKVALTLEPFPLAAVLEAEVAIFAGQSDRHTLALDAPDATLLVLGDRDRTAQVIANLLSNAIKYSPDGGAVTVAVRAGDGVVRVSITDRGFGIPAEQQHGVFTKFFRVDSGDTRRIGGTGLGLALAKEIVEAQGGAIGFESVEGVGSTFWFELPAA